MILVPVPWSERVWAWPFRTTLSWPEGAGRRAGPKTSIALARQRVLQVRRWLPERALILVLDGGCAAVDLACACQRHQVTMICRLRLDAALYPVPGAQPVSSGSSCGHRRSILLLTCLLENTVGRCMVATHARLYLLVPATPGAGRLPPAIAPGAVQSLPQTLAQLGRRRHRAQHREQRLHVDQLVDRHELPLHIGEQLLVGDLRRRAVLMPRQVGAYHLQLVIQQQAERQLKQHRLR